MDRGRPSARGRWQAFGKKLSEFDTILQDIARSRTEIDQSRLLVHRAATLLDTVGSKGARKELSMLKATVPPMVQTVVDRAMQACIAPAPWCTLAADDV